MSEKRKTPRKARRAVRRTRTRGTKTKVARRKPRRTTRGRSAAKARRKARPRPDREALEKTVKRLRAARAGLEHRLTAAVQEIGMLRQFELRTQVLEAELRKREADLLTARRELEARRAGATVVSAPQ